jgi:hypothetical protein
VRGELRAGHEYRPTRRLAAIRAAPRWRIPLQVAAALALVALGLWGFLHQPSHDTARGEPMRSSPSAAAPGVALVDSGRPIRLDPQGHVLGLEAFPAEVQARVASALSSRRVAAADLAELGGRPQRLMGPAAARPPFQLVSPVATVVEAAAPILRWQPLAGASSYRVTVLDRDLVVVAESPDLKDTEWRLPQALERGRTYVWQVAARKAGARMLAPTPPEADARFRVLDAARAEALAAARGRGESQLVLGVLYAEAGLRSEAERELRALNEANPGSPVAQALLDSVTLQLPSPTRTKPAQ